MSFYHFYFTATRPQLGRAPRVRREEAGLRAGEVATGQAQVHSAGGICLIIYCLIAAK